MSWQCDVCGHVHEGNSVPESCPLCNAPASDFSQAEIIKEKKQWCCTVCSHIHEGEEAPAECPLCHVPKEKFISVDSEEYRKILREKEEKKAAAKRRAKERSATQAATTESTKTEGNRYWKCRVCQHIHKGEKPPAKCPLCGAGAGAFIEVDASGELINSEEKDATAQKQGKQRLAGIAERFIVNFHIHPIMAHFPNGILPVVVTFLTIGLLWKTSLLENAAYYNLVAILVTLPVVIYAGFVEWKRTYMGAKAFVFGTKIICGFIVLASVATLVIWPLIQPGVNSLVAEHQVVITGITIPSIWIYLGIALIGLGAAGVAGHLGGNLVFGKNR